MSLLVVHQSDVSCLARLRRERELGGRDSEAAKIGTAAHAAAEALCYASEAGDPFDPMTVCRLAIERVARDRDMLPRSVAEALSIMAGALASRMRFFVEPGCSVYPEWKWYLDDEFMPVRSNAEAAYAGTIDQLRVFRDPARLVVIDYKTILKRVASWEVEGDWQARVYSLAALMHFPDVNEVTFRFVNLRHRLPASGTFRRGDRWEDVTRLRLRRERERRLAAGASGEWPETLGEDCAWCPLTETCRALRAAEAEGAEAIFRQDPPEIARRRLGLAALASKYDRAAKAIVEESGDPIPLGDGSVLGGKPALAWEAVMSYEDTMAELRRLGMTPEQEVEWFRFCGAQHFPGRVRSALYELCPEEAQGLIESDTIVTPTTTERFEVWWPDGKPARATVNEEDLVA